MHDVWNLRMVPQAPLGALIPDPGIHADMLGVSVVDSCGLTFSGTELRRGADSSYRSLSRCCTLQGAHALMQTNYHHYCYSLRCSCQPHTHAHFCSKFYWQTPHHTRAACHRKILYFGIHYRSCVFLFTPPHHCVRHHCRRFVATT